MACVCRRGAPTAAEDKFWKPIRSEMSVERERERGVKGQVPHFYIQIKQVRKKKKPFKKDHFYLREIGNAHTRKKKTERFAEPKKKKISISKSTYTARETNIFSYICPSNLECIGEAIRCRSPSALFWPPLSLPLIFLYPRSEYASTRPTPQKRPLPFRISSHFSNNQ